MVDYRRRKGVKMTEKNIALGKYIAKGILLINEEKKWTTYKHSRDKYGKNTQ